MMLIQQIAEIPPLRRSFRFCPVESSANGAVDAIRVSFPIYSELMISTPMKLILMINAGSYIRNDRSGRNMYNPVAIMSANPA